MTDRRALIVGINGYTSPIDNLSCCVDDAIEMGKILSSHEDEAPNYDCRVLESESGRITTETLEDAIAHLFTELDGEAIFYFSGHGMASDDGGFLVTQEAGAGKPGYPMKELLKHANGSRASVLIILDCCHSGQIGNITDGQGFNRAELGEGVTVLAASTARQESQQGMLNSVFTELLLGALEGGAADVRGQVSAASMYAYVEQSLGSWQQRPVYKSHAKQLRAVRRCKAHVPDELLRQLPKLFKSEKYHYPMDKSFEETEKKHAIPENVKIFKKFKVLRNARLLTTEDGKDLYYVALEKLTVRLTPLGRFYWRLAKDRRL